YHGILRGSDHPVLFHVRMVYQSGKYKSDKSNLYHVPVRYGCAVPDGNVYTIQDFEHAAYGESVGHYRDISGLWRRTLGIHVHWIYEIHSAGDRGGGHDRRLYAHPDIFPR